MAAASDCRLPDAANRAAAHDGAPAPWSATRNQDGVEKPAFTGRGQPIVMEQEDQIGERGAAA